jgi:DNA-binding transcriptional LysR family regulator
MSSRGRGSINTTSIGCKEIRDGTLRWVLPQAAIEEPGLFLYFPRRASEAPKLRAFIQVAREVLRPEAAPSRS